MGFRGYEFMMKEAKTHPTTPIVTQLVNNQAKAKGTVDDMLLAMRPYYYSDHVPKWKKSKYVATERNLRPYLKLPLSKITFAKIAEIMKNADRQDKTFRHESCSHIIEGIQLFCDGKEKAYNPRGGSLKTLNGVESDEDTVKIKHQTVDIQDALNLISDNKGRFSELRNQLKELLANVPPGKAEIFKPVGVTDLKELLAIRNAISNMLFEQRSPFTCSFIKKAQTFIFIRKEDNPNARQYRKKGDKNNA